MKTHKVDLQLSLERSLARHQVPGASVALLYKGETTTAAAGLTNVTTGVEVTPDTVMHIGSITKVLNATLVMQLVDEGRLHLDERVVRYLPDLRLKDQDALGKMTVKMLLNHSSGLDGDLLPDYGHDEETIEKGIARFADRGQIFSPGADFSYSNAATVIAGYLVQRLLGRSWYDLVRERVFRPLRMEHSVTLPEEALLHRASVGHFLLPPPNQRLVRTSFAFLPLSFSPCGTSLMTSASDLLAFARAHLNGGTGEDGARILSAQSTQLMQHMTVANKGSSYTGIDGIGVGWMVSRSGLLNHGGGGPGIASWLYVHPGRGFAAAVLTNAAHGMSVINEVMEPWIEEVAGIKPIGVADVQAPSRPVRVEGGKYVGVYEDLLNRYHVSQTAEGLELSKQAKHAYYDNISTEATRPARLIPLGDGSFLLESDSKEDDRLTAAFRIFNFRNEGPAGHMQHLGSAVRLYKRVGS